MLTFHNPGELDPRLAITFGTNVKEGDSPIGFFGTGLKYAIAGICRLGGTLELWSGETKFEFKGFSETIRGKEFKIINMKESPSDGSWRPLGFTTELGRHWEPWMLYRELYTNALDEGGGVELTAAGRQPSAGSTLIRVNCTQLLTVHSNRHKYFCSGEPIVSTPACQILPQAAEYLFYRGIAVKKLDKPSLFTYNIQEKQDLTEDRTLANEFYVGRIIPETVARLTQKSAIKDIILAKAGTFERDLDWSRCYVTPSDEFFEVAREVLLRSRDALESALRDLIRKHFPEPETFPPAALSKIQQARLAKAQAFLAKLGYEISHPVVVTAALDKDVLGRAKDGTAYISLRCFDQGTKQVVATLLEEHLHLTKGYRDLSYELQNFLFERMITYAEEMLGEPL